MKNGYMDQFERLRGVDPRLITVLVRAAREFHKYYPHAWIRITEGQRTLVRQKQLVNDGISPTMDSNHLKGRAVDIAVMIGNEADWDFHWYTQYNKCVQKEANDLGVSVQWGGDWTSRDGPHFELVLFRGKNL